MNQAITLTPEAKLRYDFFSADTIHGRILVKRAARKAGYEALARELEQVGYVPAIKS